MTGRVSAAVVLALAALAAAPGDVKNAKALFFDKHYREARQAWEDVRRSGPPDEARAALYWVARSSESLGEDDRALDEYASFLALGGTDPVLAEEARTHRVGLAARLVQQGHKERLSIVRDALNDESRTVRYFAAFQLADLGPELGRSAVPVLRQILAEEHDNDLLDRAKLKLLRLDPKALQGAPSATGRRSARAVQWVKVRVYDAGAREPSVSVNLPLALAELLFKSLPEDARRELGKKGYDEANFWKRLRELGPTQILEIKSGDGGRVEIWTE